VILQWNLIRLVSGSGDLKVTKDGNVLLHEMVSNFKNKQSISDYFKNKANPTSNCITHCESLHSPK
jgi:hypothetical protein